MVTMEMFGKVKRMYVGDINGVLYWNDGDWVESCSALVARHDGRLVIANWADGTGGMHHLDQVTSVSH